MFDLDKAWKVVQLLGVFAVLVVLVQSSKADSGRIGEAMASLNVTVEKMGEVISRIEKAQAITETNQLANQRNTEALMDRMWKAIEANRSSIAHIGPIVGRK